MAYSIDKIVATKFEGDKKWTITADLRGLETFGNCESNYDIVDKLKQNGVLSSKTDEDSEYCQFWGYFTTKKSADSFITRLGKYVEKRKKIIGGL